jgi:hypothetical protein
LIIYLCRLLVDLVNRLVAAADSLYLIAPILWFARITAGPLDVARAFDDDDITKRPAIARSLEIDIPFPAHTLDTHTGWVPDDTYAVVGCLPHTLLVWVVLPSFGGGILITDLLSVVTHRVPRLHTYGRLCDY